MNGRIALRVIAGALALGVVACAPPRIRLPQGPWSPAPEAVSYFDEASRMCATTRTLTAEVAVSGRAGDTRVRGRLIAGLTRPGSVRLEAPAPFGAPAFVLAARDEQAVLYFPRDGRVLADAAVADVLEALAGIRRSGADLHAMLSGCVVADRRPSNGRIADGGYAQVDLSEGVSAFLRGAGGRWTIVGGRGTGQVSGAPEEEWAMEYSDAAAGLPRTIRFSSREGGARTGSSTTLSLRLTQLETNVPIDDVAFTLAVPDSAVPLSLDELRQMGPLADRPAEKR